MNQSDEIVVLSGEPYLKEDVLLKIDPEQYIWQAELSDWISSWFDKEYPEQAALI